MKFPKFPSLAVLSLTAIVACAALTHTLKTALDSADIACVFRSRITDAPALAKFCGLAEPLIPVLRDMIGQREGALQSGVAWPSASDAGTMQHVRDAAAE